MVLPEPGLVYSGLGEEQAFSNALRLLGSDSSQFLQVFTPL
jgi:hypothetical protein